MSTKPAAPKKPRKAAPAKPRRTATPAPEAAHEAGAEAEAPRRAVPQTPEELWQAGLNAFRLENLLGMGAPQQQASTKPPPALGLAAFENFGFRKFEGVFDQRVARALEHLGWPDAAGFQALQDEVVALRGEVERLRAAAGRKSTSAKAAPAARKRKPT